MPWVCFLPSYSLLSYFILIVFISPFTQRLLNPQLLPLQKRSSQNYLHLSPRIIWHWWPLLWTCSSTSHSTVWVFLPKIWICFFSISFIEFIFLPIIQCWDPSKTISYPFYFNYTYPHLPLIKLNFSDALLIFIYSLYISFGVSQVVPVVKNLPASVGDARYMWFQALGREDPLEYEMAPRSSILA